MIIKGLTLANSFLLFIASGNIFQLELRLFIQFQILFKLLQLTQVLFNSGLITFNLVPIGSRNVYVFYFPHYSFRRSLNFWREKCHRIFVAHCDDLAGISTLYMRKVLIIFRNIHLIRISIIMQMRIRRWLGLLNFDAIIVLLTAIISKTPMRRCILINISLNIGHLRHPLFLDT